MRVFNVSLLIFFLFALSSYSLPECEGLDYTDWHNCFGTFASPSGNKYVGEFKDGKFHGQGTLIKPDGTTLKLLNGEPIDQ